MSLREQMQRFFEDVPEIFLAFGKKLQIFGWRQRIFLESWARGSNVSDESGTCGSGSFMHQDLVSSLTDPTSSDRGHFPIVRGTV